MGGCGYGSAALGLQGGENVLRVAAGVYTGVVALNASIRSNDHPDTSGRLGGSVVASAIGHAHAAIDVAQQRKVEVELLAKCSVVRRRIATHTQDGSIDGVVIALEVAEPATLDGSARGIGNRVKPKHQGLSPVVAKSHRVSVIVLDTKVRRCRSNL